MKKSLCIYFEIHQPVRLRTYHFFDIGKRRDYFDDYANRSNIRTIAKKSYIPANDLFLELNKKYGNKLKAGYSISGTAIEQLELHAPEVLESFKALNATGCVEFLAETYAHSLASLSETDEFEHQTKLHSDKIEALFGMRPKVFRNSSLIYSDKIGERVGKMGYRGMITDGAKHILGWRSPNFLYTNPVYPRLKLLLKNSRLSDDISIRFSDRNWQEWPLTADKYVNWIENSLKESDVVNIFMNYEVFGKHHSAESGIFDFLYYLTEKILSETEIDILMPSEALERYQPVAPLPVPNPISWADEEKDIANWLGNELQIEAFEELYKTYPMVKALNDPILNRDFLRLQASDHFYYMRTKLLSMPDKAHIHTSPYDSPYEAFINYMNVLSDFILRIEETKENNTNKIS